MDRNTRERAKRYHAAVAEILLHEWDPLGVVDVPEADDEYDTYVNGVTSLLVRGASKEKLIAYLWTVETQNIGLDGDRPRIESTVARLLELRRDIDGGD
ncbi:MAG TPA: hypothetical protein VJW75_10970 [Candidatus Eisenbacteria bacterium]|nr:hypothetical protein [Candidatus Eisenbacteria bacterium]